MPSISRKQIWNGLYRYSYEQKQLKFSDYPLWPIRNVSGNENNDVKYTTGTNIDIHEGANQADYLIGKSGYEYTGKT